MDFHRDERGFLKPLLGALILIGLGVLLVPYVILGKVVPPDMIGVRQNFFSIPPFLEGGFSSVGLQPGLHWQVPAVSRIELIPRRFQFVTFSEGDSGGTRTFPELLVPTTDGSKVKTDVTLILRFFEHPGQAEIITKDENANAAGEGLESAPKAQRKMIQHGGPRELIDRFTTNVPTILEKFAQRAENELRQTLSQLSTSDYYNPKLREEATLDAHDRIAESVGQNGIELWGTLVRRYSYAEKKIDDQIFAKNLQDQIERLNSADSRLAAAKANTERERALWDAKIASLEVEGHSKVSVTESQGTLFESQRKAEGDLLVATARAEVDARRADALGQIAGADVYIARELAPLLKTLRGGVISDVDPYDIDAWILKLLGKEGPR